MCLIRLINVAKVSYQRRYTNKHDLAWKEYKNSIMEKSVENTLEFIKFYMELMVIATYLCLASRDHCWATTFVALLVLWASS